MSAVSLFIHSSGTGPWLWSSVPDAVVAGTTKVSPANIGYPPNERLRRGTISSAAEDAASIVEALPVDADEVHVYAHSYGGNVALHVGALLGPRLKTYFLVEPVLFAALYARGEAPADAMVDLRGFFEHPWFLKDTERGGTEEWLEIFIDYWNRPGAWKAMPEAMRANALEGGWKVFQEVTSCAYEEVPFEPWRLDVPTTLVMGERTTPAAKAVCRTLALLNPHAVLVELRKLGHMATLTQPAAIHLEMLAHVARR